MKHPRIAVLCALPPERNTGMFTVDLAAKAFLTKACPDAEIRQYVWGHTSPWGYREQELPFQYADLLANRDSFLAADLRVIWGDFTQAAKHWLPDPEAWPNQHPEVGPEAVARLVFLSESDEQAIARTIVFGGTIITNQAADQLNESYDVPFRRFFRSVGDVFFRDPLSAAKVAPLRGRSQTLGVDCAFLLEDGDLAQLDGYRPPHEARGIGVFFGRTASIRGLLAFSRSLANNLGEQPSWLHWFWSNRRTRLLARLYGYAPEDNHPHPVKILSQLRGLRFVVTDTYHLCVNAWRMGIPAICIGSGSTALSDSLGDKKKEVFYEMFGARDFYIFSENLRTHTQRKRAARVAAAVLMDQKLVNVVIRNQQLHVASAKELLTNSIDRILGATPPAVAPAFAGQKTDRA